MGALHTHPPPPPPLVQTDDLLMYGEGHDTTTHLDFFGLLVLSLFSGTSSIEALAR